MFFVTKEFFFCYGHRLMDYEGKCGHPHGHNGKIQVELASPALDERGMVIDFEDIKNALKSWIDENLDHRMLLRLDDPLVGVLKDMNEPVFVMEDNPTAENIARVIFEQAKIKGLGVTRIRLWETPGSSAVFEEPAAQ